MTPTIDAHVCLDTHSTHPSAVTAVLTGTRAHIAHLGLEGADWTAVADNVLVLVLVRIDGVSSAGSPSLGVSSGSP
ncbi:hypothetical protein Stsp02_32520 [Streptomyces sp. NBRC 14336]|uniref:hypothetical protein n=1 Tax=Streptomyces TaxID=1883 RepID=UPI0024A194DA|nr:hypothetical protein [Streptomyces sp. NBRC 14336]GLW47590.1 hypothetical protein Stsp02_32520 [Streptomyces sp. NBRC 14336]